MTAVQELYRFVEGNSDFIYTVTSADVEVEYNGETYVPVALGRDEVESKGEMSKENLKVSFSLANAIARKWFVSSLDFPLTLTIFSKEEDIIETEWKGRLTSVSPDKADISFTFESVFTSMRRMGLRQRYQVTCPHALYGKGCKLEKDDFEYSVSITDVTNTTITIPEAASFPAGFLKSGIFEDNAGNLRFITSHDGAEIKLIRPMNPLIEYVAINGYGGLVGRVFPGCDRTTNHCKNRFDNLDNYGGFPFIPGKNPFGGSSIV